MNEKDQLEDLRQTLASLAQSRGETVPEVVEVIKANIMRDGASPEIVARFFEDLDAAAALHIN